MISNRYGQADRWRLLLKRINTNGMADGGTATARVSVLPGFADGGSMASMSTTAGTVWHRRESVAPVSQGVAAIDYDRLEDVMIMARPMIGHQTVMPHNYGEFRRQQRADKIAAFGDGSNRSRGRAR